MKTHLLITLSLLVGCEELELSLVDDYIGHPLTEITASHIHYWDDSLEVILSNEVLERAFQMATMEWTPIHPIPKNNGGFYLTGKKVTGAPYSSVKEINTYLFQDVSYHTFMTAVHNPKSVLYTENLSKAPYHGKNCASYYGAVCSSAVMYALGIDVPFYVRQIKELPFMEKLEDQDIDSLKICDVILNAGHAQMIFEVEHKDDSVSRITTFESTGTSARLIKHSREQFLKMWETGGYVGYRYKKLKFSEETKQLKGFEPVSYNDDLCPSKGDKSVYRTTDTVKINVFNSSYNRIALKNCSTSYKIVADICGEEHCYFDLQPGIYSVSLQKEEGESTSVSFEIIDTNVSCSESRIIDHLTVYFQSSSNPVYLTLCDLSGTSSYYHYLTAKEKERGHIFIPVLNSSGLFCKIVFKGQYGRIVNKPVKVE